MILVDTNIFIAVIRTGDPKLVGLLQQQTCAVCGVVRAELLAGARSPAERTSVLSLLAPLGAVPIPESLWDAVGDNLRTLRKHGVTVPFPDAVLATVAIANNLELWTRDHHFKLIQQCLPTLQLFQEPP